MYVQVQHEGEILLAAVAVIAHLADDTKIVTCLVRDRSIDCHLTELEYQEVAALWLENDEVLLAVHIPTRRVLLDVGIIEPFEYDDGVEKSEYD